MENEQSHNEKQGLIQNINELETYNNIIKCINDSLNRIYSINTKYNYHTRHQYRTPDYLFVSTIIKNNNKEYYGALYTPFGMISPIINNNTEFQVVNNMIDWNIVDVTNKIKVYEFDQEKMMIYGPLPTETHQQYLDGKEKIYLIKSVEDFCIPIKKDDELRYFSFVFLTEEQMKKDKEFMKKTLCKI